MDYISELRQDITSGDWVVIAKNRGKRPRHVAAPERLPSATDRSACPFEVRFENATLVLSAGDDWFVQSVPNKYPALGSGLCNASHTEGPYRWTEGVGFHEVVITRDHDRPIAKLNGEEAALLVRSYRDRFVALKMEPCVEYVSVFHNHGSESGASVAHPHSQIITTPVIPPDIARSLRGSANYYQEHHTCVHCVVIEHELKAGTRVVYENQRFVVIVPYASRTAYEIRIFPKVHSSRFEDTSDEDLDFLANALQTALGKLSWGLGDPSHNFFLHTAPVREEGFSDGWHHYHWHFEIVPKVGVWAGFEISTGIEISSIAPEEAAEILRAIEV